MDINKIITAAMRKQAYFENEFTDYMFGDAEQDTDADYDLDNPTYDNNEKYWQGLYKGHQRVFDSMLANPIDEYVTDDPAVQGKKITSLDVLPLPANKWMSYADWKNAVAAAMQARDADATEQLLSVLGIRGNTAE